MQEPDCALEPLEGILAVLDRGSATGTNKFALLLALIELAPELGRERAVSSDLLARKVVEIHWDHTRPWDGEVLQQVTSPNRTLSALTAIGILKKSLSARIRHQPWELAEPRIPEQHLRKCLQKVRRDLWRNPIKKLQVLPGLHAEFLYRLDGQSILLLEDAVEALLKFGPVLRPLIESRFVSHVIKANPRLRAGDLGLQIHEHLFGEARHMPPIEVRQALWEIQEGRCFYTRERIPRPSAREGTTTLDHVIPWSRQRLSLLDNFAVSKSSANYAKSNLLLGRALLDRWVDHLVSHDLSRREIGSNFSWPANHQRFGLVATSLYRNAPDGTPLWNGPGSAVSILSRAERTTILDQLVLLT